jgi:hypothetical protein
MPSWPVKGIRPGGRCSCRFRKGLRRSQAKLLSVTFDVMFGCVFRMLKCMGLMTVRKVRVMSGLLVVARVVMLCRLGVVMSRQSVMMGCLTMFVCCLL